MGYEVVVLVSANVEWHIVREMYAQVAVRRTPYGEWFSITLPVTKGDMDVCIMHGGWGKIAAAASTQYAIDVWSPGLLVNLGTCGGFAGHITRETVMLVSRTLVYDIYEQMGDPTASIAHYTTDLDMNWLQKPYPIPVQCGMLVSGDRDLVPEEVTGLHETYGAVAGDWESSSIAYVAQKNGVRCLILRMVTDLVSRDGGEVYDGTLDLFQERARKAMRTLFASLPGWLAAAGY